MIENYLSNKFFDFIFYFISPKIEPYKNKNNDYNFLYIDIFKIIYNKTNNYKTKIFYPSTYFIDNKNPTFISYINSKIRAENWITMKDKKKDG